MERIASIIQQLQEAVNNRQDAAHLLVLSRMLQAEIENLRRHNSKPVGSARVAVVLPAAPAVATPSPLPQETESIAPVVVPVPVQTAPPVVQEPEEKVFEILRVDEEELEAELEEIKQKAEFVNKVQAQQKMVPGLLFEAEPEIPTLVHQPNYRAAEVKEELKEQVKKEVNETVTSQQTSLNEQLAEARPELAQKLSEQPVKDLRKAIGINDRYVFINELFRGDEAMYERSIKTINNFSIFAEAEYWIQRELKIKLGWDDTMPAVAEFYALIKRRFS